MLRKQLRPSLFCALLPFGDWELGLCFVVLKQHVSALHFRRKAGNDTGLPDRSTPRGLKGPRDSRTSCSRLGCGLVVDRVNEVLSSSDPCLDRQQVFAGLKALHRTRVDVCRSARVPKMSPEHPLDTRSDPESQALRRPLKARQL